MFYYVVPSVVSVEYLKRQKSYVTTSQEDG